MKRSLVGACAAWCLLIAAAWGQGYVAVELFPFTFDAGGSGVFGGDVAGTAADGPNVAPHNSAWLAKGPSGDKVDLRPLQWPGFNSGGLSATDGIHQVGSAGYLPGIAENKASFYHAAIWSGTPESAVDLHPTNLTGFVNSSANGLAGNQQVGGGDFGGPDYVRHALLWSGTAASTVDIHPAQLGFTGSLGFNTDGTHQVGVGILSSYFDTHAVMWSGTAASAIDLHPANFATSQANAVAGNDQVGSANDGVNGDHAMLWHGSAASAIDLNPTNLAYPFLSSAASGTNGTSQVGMGSVGDPANGPAFPPHALLWNGTADSAVDLHLLLPAKFNSLSVACTIDSNGIVYGFAYDGETGQQTAVEWIPVPEPSTFALAVGTVSLAVGRRRTRQFFSRRGAR